MRERNEEICEQDRWVAVIPVIIKPTPIPVPVPPVAVPVEATDFEVAIGVAKCIERRLFHHLSNTLKVVFYPASQMP
jgi:hypothetical protein